MRSPARQAGNRLVEEQARRQVQTFFDELKNGTRNYRTVASLSGQITQEYRGRCVLELLQNAHDALGGARRDDPRRIAFVLATGPEPVLLAANSGRPFRRRDFEGVCQLGQSPKDPNESVGNKGLGFQSVLEVSTRPRIWSTAVAEGDPEFAFGFDPTGTMRLVEQAVAEIENGVPTSRSGAARRIVNWSEDQLRAYRARSLSGEAPEAANEAQQYMSPYSIPLPVGDRPPEVAELLDAGYATVIRLPLDGGRAGAVNEDIQDFDQAAGTTADRRLAVSEAVESIKDQLDELSARSTLFLPDLERLTIDVDGERRVLERIVDSNADLPGARPATEQVLLVGRSAGSPPDTATREFRVWTRCLGGDGDPAEAQRIQDAVSHLPNRWPEVRQVEVGVAVEDAASPAPGKFVIFLPTEVDTGTGALVNAPFYGSLDRRQINFEDEYNALLLEYVMDLALDVAAALATGPTETWRGRAIVDLLASAGPAPASGRPTLMERMRQRAEEVQHGLGENELANAGLLLCLDGWQSAAEARIMPEVPGGDPLGTGAWREAAGFKVLSPELDGRRSQVEALLECLGGSSAPTPAEWADTVERLAERIQAGETGASWDAFLNSLLAILPEDTRSPRKPRAADPLAEARFLPTQDGRLIRASDSVQLFFPPRRGVDDAAEFVDAVPDALKARIAFLDTHVQTHEGPQRHNTEVQKFLDGRFVQSFRREDLIRDVVVPALPELPAPHDSPDARRCSQILRWTLALVSRSGPATGDDLPESQLANSVLSLLRDLPVACGSDWRRAGEAVFGPGWPGRGGDSIRTLADGLAAGGTDLLNKALLPPTDPRWSFDATAWGNLLEHAGVVDGLPTESAEPVLFRMSKKNRRLPRQAPSGAPQGAWDDWLGACGDELAPQVSASREYRLDGIRLASGIHSLPLLDAPARKALSALILASLDKWDNGWESATMTRTLYPAVRIPVTSPLKHWLMTLPWLHDKQTDPPRPLHRRWYVPESLLRGQAGRFSHLAPLSLELAHRLGENPELLATLRSLGLNVYPTEDDRTGPELLEALADAHERQEMPAGGFDVFLGQVRHAWRHLDGDGTEDGEPAQLPSRFLVRTKARTFGIRSGTDLADVFLPDHNTRTRSLRDRGKPILEMLLAEAQGATGKRIANLGARRASRLHEICLADGRPVSGAAIAAAVPLEETEFDWLPLVLLTLAAHGGTNPRGPATDAWRSALTRLQGASALRCGSLAVELMDADQVVAPDEPGAHWLPEDGVLLLRHDAGYDDLASAGQAILERQDLLKDLRLVLGALPGAGREPTPQQIEAALDRAEIDGEALADIRLRWFGATALLVDRLRPVLKLLGVSDDSLDAAATESEALKKWLSARLAQREAQPWPARDVIATARKSRDDAEMGRAAFLQLGETAQLPVWNKALEELGERYAPVANGDVADQVKRHIEEAAPCLQALARHVALESAEPDLFRKLEGATREVGARLLRQHDANRTPPRDDPSILAPDSHDAAQFDTGAIGPRHAPGAETPRGLAEDESYTPPADWSARWWEVPLSAVLAELRTAWARELDADSSPNEVLDKASSLDELRAALVDSGVDLDADPYGVCRDNENRLKRVISRLHDLYRAWLEVSGTEPAAASSESPALPPTDSSAYLRAWTVAEIFQRALGAAGDGDFRRNCEGCTSLGEARETLGVTPEAIERARRERSERRRQAQREKRTIKIAGQPFVVDDDDYGDLLARLDTLPVPKGPRVRSDDSTSLVRPAPGPARTAPGARTPGRTSHLYASPHLPIVIGIVGEMWAYRYLQSQFGSQVVTPATWVSENSLKVLPPAAGEQRDASDSHGFDFRFSSDGIAWHFEVKATTEDDTSFSLPPSEIRAATRLAGDPSVRWRILRVRRARSDTPEFDVLPNPFETGFSDLFEMSRSGLTVRYALDTAR